MLKIMASYKQPWIKVFLLFALGLGIWAYFPGLSGTFVFDDVSNISTNNNLKIDNFTFDDLLQASWSGYSGPLRRPLAMFSFAVNHVFTGMDPWWMKLGNLLIHVFNSLVLLLLCKELFLRLSPDKQNTTIAAPYFIAAVWFVHPINVTAVSFIVQRMTSMSGTFVLLAVYCYLKLRNGKFDQWKAYALSVLIMVFWGLGLLTKEIAISLSIYVFAIEWCVYGFHTESKEDRIHLRLLWALLAAPWVGALFYAFYKPAFLFNGYGFRDFTVYQRVLTEFRIVIEYISLSIIPDIRDMGLFHDDIVISTSLFSPVSTLLSLLLILGLLVSAYFAKKRFALYSLGIFWFFGGHLLESTIYPLELMFLHRNYLPSIGILLVLAEAARCVQRTHRNLLVVAVISVMILFAICTRSLAYQWSDDYRMQIIEVMTHPESIRANFRAAQIYKVYAIITKDSVQRDIYRGKALEYFANIQKLDKHDIRGKMGMLQTYLQMEEEPSRILIEDLIVGLKQSKMDGGTLNTLQAYKDCMISSKCVLMKEDYHRIVEAILNNPEVAGDFRRKVLVMHAEYLARAMGDMDAAIKTILEAIVGYPTADDLMLLAQYYEEGGYKQDAIRTVDYLEQQDKLGRFRKFIRATRERIEH